MDRQPGSQVPAQVYDELLPALHQSGKTIVAVSHDDRHLSELKMPARKLRMEDGRFVVPEAAIG
jgi:ABC-type siderophore export system fused ATPase/permease subunit